MSQDHNELMQKNGNSSALAMEFHLFLHKAIELYLDNNIVTRGTLDSIDMFD